MKYAITSTKCPSRYVPLVLKYAMGNNYNINGSITLRRQWYIYRPKRSFGQGNIFTHVCHSFCSRGGCIPACLAGQSRWGGGWVSEHALQVSPRGVSNFLGGLQFSGEVSNFLGGLQFSGIRSTFGWYASYWNAFLFSLFWCRCHCRHS